MTPTKSGYYWYLTDSSLSPVYVLVRDERLLLGALPALPSGRIDIARIGCAEIVDLSTLDGMLVGLIECPATTRKLVLCGAAA